jgi:hypothetical protein
MIASVVPYDKRNHASDAESRRRYCVWSGQGWKDEVPAAWPVRMTTGTRTPCALTASQNDGAMGYVQVPIYSGGR